MAREHGLELVPDTAIRSFILLGPAVGPAKWFESLRLSDDGVHPNVEGYHVWAKSMEPVLRKLLNDKAVMPNKPDAGDGK